MNLRNTSLLANIILLVITFTNLLWNVDSDLFITGAGIGILVSIPSVVALLAPNRIGENLLIRINLGILLLLALITLAMLYNQLIDLNKSDGQSVVKLVVVLFLALALCASVQMFIITTRSYELVANVDTFLQRIYGGPSTVLMLAIAIILTGVLQSMIFVLSDISVFFDVLQSKLLQRGIIPYMCLLLFFWGLLLIISNYIILRFEFSCVTGDLNTKLKEPNSATCLSLLMLFKEAKTGNSKAKKLVCVEQLSEYIWSKSEHLYSLPRYINWAVPILGFIGTVLGISLAAESIGGLISSPDTNFSAAIGDAIAPLGIAFDTTLVALSLSVVLMLVQTLSQRWQERQLQQIEQKIRDIIV